MNAVLQSTEISKLAGGYHVQLEQSKNEDDFNEFSIAIFVHFSWTTLCIRILHKKIKENCQF